MAALIALAAGPAAAADLQVVVRDDAGAPVADAVVTLTPPTAAPASQALPAKAYIDQRNETFIPLVTILPVGGTIQFRNSDHTMHQVYSFSPPKRFELEVDIGETSPPVTFDKPGLVAIGCNIHDQMITYVVVSDNPLTKLSGKDGIVRFPDLPPGHYRASIWQPNMIGAHPSDAQVDLASSDQLLSFALKLMAPRMTHMSHMGSY